MKNGKKRLKIGFDVDDTILDFFGNILKDLDIKPNGIIRWNFPDFSEEDRVRIFNKFADKEFIRDIPVEKKIRDFINNLAIKHDVYFVTATNSAVATERMFYLKKHFPRVKDENIIIAGDKSVFRFDIFFDDNPKNLLGYSKNNILVNQEWNTGHTRFPIIRSLEDMIEIINMVELGSSKNDIFKRFKSKNINNESIVLLQGHTGSGKNFILENYMSSENRANLGKVRTTTTRVRRKGEDDSSYNFISLKSFQDKIKRGDFIEYTNYNGSYYGTEKKELERVLNEGKRPVLILDKDGIESFNSRYNNVIDIYIKRDPEDTIMGLLERDGSLSRLGQLVSEIKTLDEHRCRYTLINKRDKEFTLRNFERLLLD